MTEPYGYEGPSKLVPIAFDESYCRRLEAYVMTLQEFLKIIKNEVAIEDNWQIKRPGLYDLTMGLKYGVLRNADIR